MSKHQPHASDNNTHEVPTGDDYYPEMGQRPPASAIIEASSGGRHAYLKFLAVNRPTVMAAIAATKVRYSKEDAYVSCITGEPMVSIFMTRTAYEKFRKTNRAICTSAILLD